MTNQRLIEFIERVSKAKTKDEIWVLTANYLKHIGFETVNFATINKHTKDVYGFYSTMSPDWMGHYIKSGYDGVDPWVNHVTKSRENILYSKDFATNLKLGKTSQETMLMDECCDAGLRSATLYSFHSDFSDQVSGINIGTESHHEEYSKRFDEHKDEIYIISSLANVYLASDAINTGESNQWYDFDALRNKRLLTNRELDVLNWLASGMRNDKIAHLLDISTETVNFHMKSIKKKLGAKTREHAIAIAHTRKLLK